MMLYAENLAEGRKTKLTHPYSYDPIVQYRASGESNGTIYTDRLLQWDFEKHDKLCVKHFGNTGQYWDNREPEKIEAFLRDWCDYRGLMLIQVTEYCNQATGYPTWRLDYLNGANAKAVGLAGIIGESHTTDGLEG